MAHEKTYNTANAQSFHEKTSLIQRDKAFNQQSKCFTPIRRQQPYRATSRDLWVGHTHKFALKLLTSKVYLGRWLGLIQRNKYALRCEQIQKNNSRLFIGITICLCRKIQKFCGQKRDKCRKGLCLSTILRFIGPLSHSAAMHAYRCGD